MSVAVRCKAWGGLFTVRTLVVLSAFAIALGVPLNVSQPSGQRVVSLEDRLLMLFGPAFSATVDIKDPAAQITLKFYRVWDVTSTDGRYLTVSTPRGKFTRAICGFDWFYRSRTSIYLTEDRNIAVLGPAHCDYLVSLDPPGMTEAVNSPSAGWTYLGAFGLAQHPAGPGPDKFELRFAPASEQGECIELLSADPAGESSPRHEARTKSCPPLQWLEPRG